MDEARLVFLLLCVLFVGLGIPLWIAMVPPNRFYGVRTATTLGDEAVWYAANRAAGRDIVLAGFPAFLLSVLLPEYGVEGAAYVLLMTAVLALGCAYVVVVGLARMRHLRTPL